MSTISVDWLGNATTVATPTVATATDAVATDATATATVAVATPTVATVATPTVATADALIIDLTDDQETTSEETWKANQEDQHVPALSAQIMADVAECQKFVDDKHRRSLIKRLCFDFQRKGFCDRANCPFRHKSPTKPCRFFDGGRGHCRNGNACNFSHAIDIPTTDTTAVPTAQTTQVSSPVHVHVQTSSGSTSTKPCFSMATVGFCRFGENCMYNHTLEIPECTFFKGGKGTCRQGTACPYIHTTIEDAN